ncbi:hypothetical protein [Providencia sp. Me31A]|uniref:hypothetical protein n=1 Tax=Providencia sp. Me31A TaxID=3392637 RepID=UPI003D2D4DE8
MTKSNESVQKSKFTDYYPTSLVYTVKDYNYFIGIARNKSFVIYEITKDGEIDLSKPVQDGVLTTFHDDLQVVYDPKNSKQFLVCTNIAESTLDIYTIYANGSIKVFDSLSYKRDSKQGTAIYTTNGFFYFYEQSKRTLEWEIRKFIKE